MLSFGVVSFEPDISHAESWCADPLIVHEWGVQLFGDDGHALDPPDLPAYFHDSGPSGASAVVPVSSLPPDSGMRELPLLHFYTSGSWAESVPVGVEVGFTLGRASDWYPQVDRLRVPPESARLEDESLGSDSGDSREPMAAAAFDLAPDGSAQLSWDALTLTRDPQQGLEPAAATSWVSEARAIDALWVNSSEESERFVFYEAGTREEALVALERGDTWSPDQGHYVALNSSPYDVHDVFVVHRSADAVSVFFAARIPAESSAGFVLESHAVDGDLEAATRDVLAARLVDQASASPSAIDTWAHGGECIMGRDPAESTDQATGHRLYTAEVEMILNVWNAAFFEREGTTILYREDTAYIDAMMPLSIYTDMFHYPLVRRLGLAVVALDALPE
jgi:hypothetical protein